MNQQSLPVRQPVTFNRTLALSLILHGALAVAIAVMPRQLAQLGPSQIIAVNLADMNLPQVPENRAPLTRPEAPPPPSPREMSMPEPAQAVPQEPVPPIPAEPRPAQQVVNTEQSSLSLGMTRGFFRSLADGQTLRPDVREYYFALVQRINDKWWTVASNGGVEPGRGEALVTIVMRRDGELLDIQLRKSSGSAEYDRMILNALQAAAPLPPLPDSYPGDIFQAPLRLMAPRGLLFS